MNRTRIDPVMLRAQGLGVATLAMDLPLAGWLAGVVGLLTALQDELVDQYGERAVFGPLDENGKPTGVGWCRYCGVPIALDERGEAPVWVDATGGDVCPVEILDGNGEYTEDHGHALRKGAR